MRQVGIWLSNTYRKCPNFSVPLLQRGTAGERSDRQGVNHTPCGRWASGSPTHTANVQTSVSPFCKGGQPGSVATGRGSITRHAAGGHLALQHIPQISKLQCPPCKGGQPGSVATGRESITRHAAGGHLALRHI